MEIHAQGQYAEEIVKALELGTKKGAKAATVLKYFKTVKKIVEV